MKVEKHPPYHLIQVSASGDYHVYENRPLYKKRFKSVLKFHAPGLAPVVDEEGAYHIMFNGDAAYCCRFQRTFGFYENKAVVKNKDGYYHITTNGMSTYAARYLWCGNYQDNACVVCDLQGRYFHVDHNGKALYGARFNYVGDFRDGVAVVQNEKGMCSHIDQLGNFLHGQWFVDLDVYHKGFARAKLEDGWFHINSKGQAIYRDKYLMIEPFYNGVARVETFNGELLCIDEDGKIIRQLRKALHHN